jgi:hypothetical protein
MLALSVPADLGTYLAAGLGAWSRLPDGRVCELVPSPCGWWWVGVRGGGSAFSPASPGRALWLLSCLGVTRPDRLEWEPGWGEVTRTNPFVGVTT